MLDEKKVQWSVEADKIDANDSHHGSVPRDEVIAVPPKNSMMAPDFLEKVCDNQQIDELNTLLAELHETNEIFNGEMCRQIEAYLTLTGQMKDIQDRFEAWVKKYVLNRTKRPNNKDHGDPFDKYLRLDTELHDILGRFQMQPGTINYVALDKAIQYGRWLIYDATWRKDLICTDDKITLPFNPKNPDAADLMRLAFAEYRWNLRSLPKFGEIIESACSQTRPTWWTDAPQKYKAEIAGIMRDIDFIRPFLVGHVSPSEIALSLPNGHLLAWAWCVRYGVAHILYFESTKKLEAYDQTFKTTAAALVTAEGDVCDPDLPWIELQEAVSTANFAWSLQYSLLTAFWEKIYSHYERIDLDQIRKSSIQVDPNSVVSESQFAIACHDLALQDLSQTDDLERPKPNQRSGIRCIRLSKFLRLLNEEFGCEVKRGKGSEITVYRPGGKKHIIGGHSPNREITPRFISRILKALCIPETDWLALVGKNK